MAHVYIQPPSPESVLFKLAEFFAKTYRWHVKVEIVRGLDDWETMTCTGYDVNTQQSGKEADRG